MLKVFRDNLRKLAWILWLVIAAFVLLVFVGLPNANDFAGSPASTAASVGGHDITFADFQRHYNNVENRWREIYGDSYTPELSRQLGLPMQTMNDLVAEQILLLEAERMGLEATEGEIRDAILQVDALQDANGNFIGFDGYQQLLEQNRVPIEDFERQMREQVVLQKLNRVLAAGAWVGDRELEEKARAEAETAEIRYLRLADDDVQGVPAPTDGEVTTYFDSHREEYRLPERRKIGYLSINTNTIRAELEIPAQDLRSYYDDNSAEFTQQEQVRAQHILLFVNDERSAEQAQQELQAARKQVEAGEDFGELARRLSEDEATKERGGDLGFFTRGRMTPQFEEAAFSGATGGLVGPIENQLGPRTGYHLIKINAKQEGGLQPLEQVENRIRVRLLNERSRTLAEERARALYESVNDETISSEDQLRALAEREAVTVEVTDFVTQEDSIPGIGRGTPFAQAAFSHDPGKLSEPVRVAAGWAIFDVLEIQLPRLPEIDEVKDLVERDAAQEKKSAVARQTLALAREAIVAGTQSLEEAASSLGLEIQTSASFGASGRIVGLTNASDLVSAALALEKGEVGGPASVSEGEVLFEVSERSHFDPVAFEEAKEERREQLRLERANALLQSLINQRRDELNVTYSRDFLATFEPDGTAANTF